MHGSTASHFGSWSPSGWRRPVAFRAPKGPANVATGAAKRSERNPWQRAPRFGLSPRKGRWKCAMSKCAIYSSVARRRTSLAKNVARLRRPFGAVRFPRAVDHGFRSPGCASARCTRGSARAPRRGESRARSGVHDRRNSSAASDVACATILDYTRPSGRPAQCPAPPSRCAASTALTRSSGTSSGTRSPCSSHEARASTSVSR